MRGNRYEEILLVEDKNNLLGLTMEILRKNGKGTICITKDGKNALGLEFRGDRNGKSMRISDMSFALMYSRPLSGKRKEAELLEITPKLKVIPLLMLVGSRRDMSVITERADGAYRCTRRAVNLRDFIKKVRKMPIFWASIDTVTDGNGLE